MRGVRLALVAAAVAALSACGPQTETPEVAPVAEITTIDVVIETSVGDITVELYPEAAPVTVANFLRYVNADMYRDAAFYRVTRPDNDPMIEVIQGGHWDPYGEEEGTFAPIFMPIEHETTEMTGITHGDGAISMARYEPGTAASEFFIVIGDHPELDFGGERNPDGQGFAAFGRVTGGMDVVRAINALPVSDTGAIPGQLLAEPVTILTIRRVEEE